MALARKKKASRGKENRRTPAKRKLSNRPKKHRQWSEESMRGAMNAVKEGLMGVNRAALEFAVPRTTLKDRISGRVIHGTNTGPKPYLSMEEEKELVDFLLKSSKMGYGKTRSQVMKIVEATMKKKGMEHCRISAGWWAAFCKRWPILSLRKGDSFSIAREKMTSRDVFDSYFKMLKETLEEYDLMDKPAQIYNCDESGMPLEHKLPKTISLKGTKKVRQVTSGNKTQITVLGCANAAGQTIPPMVVFSGKRFNHELSEGEVPGTLYGMSDSGWMDSELFSNWFSNHFLKHAVSARPLMLILDGHSSHYTLELVKTAAEAGVVLFCLPPHTTADSQPLDTSCFGPLKIYWGEVCQAFMFANPGRAVTKFLFSKLFSEAWSKGMTISNICSGFRCTGIYPFDPSAILKKLPNDLEQKNNEGDDGDHGDDGQAACYSPEELERFETRFENGYDVFTDEKYVAWLQQYHPESVPQDIRENPLNANDNDGFESPPQDLRENPLNANDNDGFESPPQDLRENPLNATDNDGFESPPQDLHEKPLDAGANLNVRFDESPLDMFNEHHDDGGMFSQEELEHFEKRYENGYNVFTDEKYVAWLQKYHPDSAPSLASMFSSVSPLESGQEPGLWHLTNQEYLANMYSGLGVR